MTLLLSMMVTTTMMIGNTVVMTLVVTTMIMIVRSYIAHYHCNSFHALRPLLSLSSGNHQNYFASSRRQAANMHNLSDIKL